VDSVLTLLKELKDEESRYAYADAVTNAFLTGQIKALQEDRDLTQEQLGVLVGTKQSGISRWLNTGFSTCKVETLRKFAKAYGVRLRISFEEFGTLPTDVRGFTNERLVPRKFEDDPAFSEHARTEPGEPRAGDPRMAHVRIAETSSQLGLPSLHQLFKKPMFSIPDMSEAINPLKEMLAMHHGSMKHATKHWLEPMDELRRQMEVVCRQLSDVRHLMPGAVSISDTPRAINQGEAQLGSAVQPESHLHPILLTPENQHATTPRGRNTRRGPQRKMLLRQTAHCTQRTKEEVANG
jgi:transcriptional regulator with XRE-family HTH domain